MCQLSPLARWACSIVLLVFGVTLVLWIPNLIDQQVHQGVDSYLNITDPTQQGWDAFKYSTTKSQPQYYDVYAYSVVNVDEVLQQGKMPVFEEVGPVRFQLFEFKIDMVVSEDLSNVSYKLWRHLVPLDPVAANQTVTVPNFMLWGAAAAAQANTTDGEDLIWLIVEAILGFPAAESGIAFQQRTIAELFFGYDDPILEAVSRLPLKTKLPDRFPGLLGNLTSPAATRNQTGTSVQLTGINNISRARQFVQWNGMRSLRCCETGPCGSPATAGQAGSPTWLTEAANDLSHGAGTYGTQFPPFLPPQGSSQNLFVDSLFRTASLTSVGEETVVINGIPCQRFRIPAAELGNASVTPSNAAYRMSGLPSGLIDIAPCEAGVPVLVSKAHFLDADPSLRQQYLLTKGEPASLRDAYDTILDVEAVTGTTMQVHERLQINMRMGPFGSHLEHMPRMVWPVGWLDKNAIVTDELAAQWQSSVGVALTVTTVVLVVGWVLSGVGLGLVVSLSAAQWCTGGPGAKTARAGGAVVETDAAILQAMRRDEYVSGEAAYRRMGDDDSAWPTARIQ